METKWKYHTVRIVPNSNGKVIETEVIETEAIETEVIETEVIETEVIETEAYLAEVTGDVCPWSYSSWIYNYLCNRCLSPLMLWVPISLRARSTILCDKVCQWLAAGRWFSPGPPVSSTNKIDHHDVTEKLLKVALTTIKPNQTKTNRIKMMNININWHFISKSHRVLRSKLYVPFYIALNPLWIYSNY